jgi:hypothetical protein
MLLVKQCFVDAECSMMRKVVEAVPDQTPT